MEQATILLLVCADCGTTPHDVKHLLVCPAHLTTIIPSDLWSRPTDAVRDSAISRRETQIEMNMNWKASNKSETPSPHTNHHPDTVNHPQVSDSDTFNPLQVSHQRVLTTLFPYVSHPMTLHPKWGRHLKTLSYLSHVTSVSRRSPWSADKSVIRCWSSWFKDSISCSLFSHALCLLNNLKDIFFKSVRRRCRDLLIHSTRSSTRVSIQLTT